jgi:hypothetical protein
MAPAAKTISAWYYCYTNKILQQQILQKPEYVIMAVVAALFFAGVVTSGGHVRADDGWGAYDYNGNWHCVWQWDSNGHKVCEAYIQQPHVHQVSQWACHNDPNDPDHSCHRIYPFSSEQQPHVQEVAFFPMDIGPFHSFRGAFLTDVSSLEPFERS